MHTNRLATLSRVAVTSISVALVAALAVPGPAAADEETPPGLRCVAATLPVTVAPADPTVYHVVGRLCARGTWRDKTVQVLLPGGSYDHTYWSFPYQSWRYSYTSWATDEGFATFEVDRLGTGRSDHPPAQLVTMTSSAFVVHQVVQALRGGAVGGHAFAGVALVGHSFGSMIAVIEAATYTDVDGVAVTGFLHQLSPAGFAEIGGTFVPAALEGYITTAPGARGPDFYNQAYADPAVIALDERTRSDESGATLNDLGLAFDPAVSLSLRVSVLVLVGAQDKLFCDAATPGLSCATADDVAARESAAYPPRACLQTVVQPDSGHSVALHPNGRDGFQAITRWAARRVGVGAGRPATDPCPAG